MATYYYVGTGTSGTPTGWNSASLWSSSSGGSGGAGIPGSADTAIFDLHSGYCTLDVAMNISALTLNTGFTNTLSFGAYGSTVSGSVTLIQGTLNTNGQSCAWGNYLGTGSLTRTLTLGASTITFAAASTNVWNVSTATGYTMTANTATIILSGNSSGITSNAISMNGASLVITGNGTLQIFGSTWVWQNLTYSPAVSAYTNNNLMLWGNITVNGNIVFNGNSLVPPYHPIIQSSTLGTPYTITCNGTVSISGQVDFQDIAASGTASWNLSSGLSGNCGGCSGITFTTAGSYYYYATANGNYSTLANWYLGSGGTGGAGRVPLPQDTGYWNSATGSYSCTFDQLRICSWIATGFTGTFVSNLNGLYVYGNIALSSSFTGSNYNIWLYGRGSQTITTNGVYLSRNLLIGNWSGDTGVYTLQGNFTSSNALYISGASFNANNYNLSFLAGSFSNNATLTMGSGTWTLTGSNGTLWSTNGGTCTIVPGTSTIAIIGNGTCTFAGGGKTYNNISLSGGSSQVVTITGANTFNNLTVSGKATITLASSTTHTISSLTDSSSGAGVTLNSSTSGTAATLSCASGTVSVTNWTIKDNTATGGATFAANYSNTLSNVTGWTLSPAQTSFDTTLGALAPIAWWRLADAAGSGTALDSSGNHYNGTPNAGVSLAKWYPFVYPPQTGDNFSGSGDIPTTYNNASLTAFSVVAVLNCNGYSQSYGRIVSNDSTQGDSKGFDIAINGTTALGFVVVLGNGTTYTLGSTHGTIPTTGRHLFVATWNGTTMNYYIDGVLDAYSNSFAGPLSAGSYNAMIGANPNGGTPSNFFTGNLAEIALFTTALSQTNVTNLYKAMNAHNNGIMAGILAMR